MLHSLDHIMSNCNTFNASAPQCPITRLDQWSFGNSSNSSILNSRYRHGVSPVVCGSVAAVGQAGISSSGFCLECVY